MNRVCTSCDTRNEKILFLKNLILAYCSTDKGLFLVGGLRLLPSFILYSRSLFFHEKFNDFVIGPRYDFTLNLQSIKLFVCEILIDNTSRCTRCFIQNMISSRETYYNWFYFSYVVWDFIFTGICLWVIFGRNDSVMFSSKKIQIYSWIWQGI